jgi:hypothetical protein
MGRKPLEKKGTSQYKLNRRVELRAKRLVEEGFHNSVSDLIEYATMNHIIDMEKKWKDAKK